MPICLPRSFSNLFTCLPIDLLNQPPYHPGLPPSYMVIGGTVALIQFLVVLLASLSPCLPTIVNIVVAFTLC